MKSKFTDLIDLNLAWLRLKGDISEERVFVSHPYETALIEPDKQGLDEWLSELKSQLVSENYGAKPMQVCEIPKLGGTLRPGGLLTIEDHLLYTACVGAILENIYTAIKDTQQTIEYSYPINPKLEKSNWLLGYFRAYQNYTKKSLEMVNESDINFVVVTDITGYYENIELGILQSDLNDIGAEKTIVNKLRSYLKIWSQVHVSGRGIPQGYSASDILAKLYLHSIDIALQDLGYRHIRWVDDFRIFCKSEAEAKKAIVELSRLLRKRGLCIQSAKTKIKTSVEALENIQGITPIIEKVRDDYLNQIIYTLGLDTMSYLPRAERLLLASEEETPIEVVKKAYSDFFIDSRVEKFNKTLFRFILGRLGKQKSNYAVYHCIQYIKSIPSETQTILDYLVSCNVLGKSDILEEIEEFLQSNYAVYPYQIYQIFKALNSVLESFDIHSQIVKIARKISYDLNQPSYLRTECRIFIANFGGKIDVEKLHDLYATANKLEQCEIIIALRSMENSRRNSFFSDVQNQSLLHKRAVSFVKQNKI